MNMRLWLLIAIGTLAGCAQQVQAPIPVVVTNEVRTRPVEAKAPVSEPERSDRGALGQPLGRFGTPVRTMADQIEIGLRRQGIKRLPMAITSFVDLSAPTKTRGLGDEIAEGFFHELQARGFNLIDHKAIPFATGHPHKHPSTLSEFYRDHRISYVLSGSFSRNPDGVVVQARVLDTVTRQVVATGQAEIDVTELEGGLPGYDPLSSRRGMIVENGGVPVQ